MDVLVLLEALGPALLSDTDPSNIRVVLGFDYPVLGTGVEVTATLSYNFNNGGKGN